MSKEEYQKVFRRVEEKYILTENQYTDLMDRIKEKIEPNEYPTSQILNLYLDNSNWDFATRSIQKPVYKEKIRVRSYCVPDENSRVFLEDKKKYNGVVSKRRIAINYEDFLNYLKTGNLSNPESTQIFAEIDYIIKKNDLKPKIMIAYDRFSWYLKENKDIRLTIDYNLRSRVDNLELDVGDCGKLFFDKNEFYILEIKSIQAMPLWLVKTLNELKIYPKSFSKYGEVYKKYILKKGV